MRAFFDTGKGALLGGAVQMAAVLCLVVGLGLAAPRGGLGQLVALLLIMAVTGACATIFLALATSYPPMRTRSWWAGQLAVVVLFAMTLGAWGTPALAQESSASPSASPAASPSASPSAGSIDQTQTESTTQITEGGEEETGGTGPSVSARGVDVGDNIHVDENCVRVGDITVGDCDKKPGGGSGGGSNGGQDGSQGGSGGGQRPDLGQTPPETTAPEEASPPADEGDSDEDQGEDPGQGSTPEPAGSCATEGPKEETIDATIERVVDGDTGELAEPVKGTTTVRFIGVDTPETVDPEEEPEPYGKEASTFTEKALEGEEVALELDRDAKDDYERLLAYVWVGDEMFNEALLAGGYGELLIVEPNDAHEACLAAAEAAAKEAQAGIWGLEDGDGSGNDPEPPPATDDPTDPTADPSADPADEPAEESADPTEDPSVPTDSGTEDGGDAEEPAADPVPETTAASPAPDETTPETTASSPEPEDATPAEGVDEELTENFTEDLPEDLPADAPELAFGAPQETPPASLPTDPSATPGVSEDQYSASPPATTSTPEPEIVLPDSGGAAPEAAFLASHEEGLPDSWAGRTVFVASLGLMLAGAIIIGFRAAPTLRDALAARFSTRGTRD